MTNRKWRLANLKRKCKGAGRRDFSKASELGPSLPSSSQRLVQPEEAFPVRREQLQQTGFQHSPKANSAGDIPFCGSWAQLPSSRVRSHACDIRHWPPWTPQQRADGIVPQISSFLRATVTGSLSNIQYQSSPSDSDHTCLDTLHWSAIPLRPWSALPKHPHR